MNYELLIDMIDELGRLGRTGSDNLTDYLNSSGRDGDTYVIEGFAQLDAVAKDCEMEF